MHLAVIARVRTVVRKRPWVRLNRYSPLDEAGAAMVEAALVLPLILAVVIGIAQFGVTFSNYVTLHNAVRSGTRQLAISRAPGQDACNLGEARLRGALPSLNQANLTVTWTVTTSCTDLVVGTDATMTATYPCDLNILGVNFAPSCILRAATTERVE
jgi:Flp pilus assembly protein TadG